MHNFAETPKGFSGEFQPVSVLLLI